MPSPYRDYLATNVRRLRTRKGWTQADLAEHAGMDLDYFISIERGKANPTLEKITAIAEALETTPGALLRKTRVVKRLPGRPKAVK